jgi:Kdo2-lipid IVA lauroyltransferase/acyltransferase
MRELDSAGRRRVIRGVWDNLGRTAAELPHVGALQQTAEGGPGWECSNYEELQTLQARGVPALLFSGHLGNWEIGLSVAAALGVRVSWFYRPASNPVSDRILQALRREAMGADVPMFAKGAPGARAALAHLRKGGLLGMLVDQKLNEGIAVPFFGRNADDQFGAGGIRLTPALPRHIPIHQIRLGPARFRVVCEPPLMLPDTGDHTADVRALTLTVNRILERWIREQPDCWLWLHRRWPKEALGESSAASVDQGGAPADRSRSANRRAA